MFSRRALLTLGFLLFGAPGALAAEKTTYTPAAFAKAQAEGAAILIDVHAPWCPTCRAQEPVLNKLEGLPKFDKLRVFIVDFDSQKDALRAFAASQQSTLIVFKGATEVERSVGETDPAALAALLDKTQ
jgi:thioredoxin 1